MLKLPWNSRFQCQKLKGQAKGKQNALIRTVEIVSFNMAKEASYIYFLSGQKLIKNAKNGQFGEVF